MMGVIPGCLSGCYALCKRALSQEGCRGIVVLEDKVGRDSFVAELKKRMV